jgi:lipid-binding SYLF domain-containing protein
MMKILSTLVAVALVGPVAPAFADDSAADAKKAGQEAVEAGAKAEKAGELAEKAGAKAEKAGDKAEQATESMHRQMETRNHKYARRDAPDVKQAHQAIGELERADPGLTRLFNGAAGYAVFATVGKGAVGVGGARGSGILFERGTAVGKTTLTQLTVGLQLGGQAYSEVVFFETEKALADFKKSEFTMAAQLSAVAVTTGASANAKYVEGVSVFTLAKGGVMAEASVGGQKFTYHAFQKPIASITR